MTAPKQNLNSTQKVIADGMDDILKKDGLSLKKELTIRGSSTKELALKKGLFGQKELTIKGLSDQKKLTTKGLSGQKELTIKGLSDQKELTIKGLSAEEKLAVKKGLSDQRELIIKGLSGQKDLTIKGLSNQKELTIKGLSAEEKLAVQKGLSDQKELTIKSPKSDSNVIDKVFAEFYIREFAYHTDGLTDKKIIDSGLECGGENNLGITFIYENPEDNVFWICQSIYKKRNSYLTQKEIADFFEIHTQVKNSSITDDANRPVRESLQSLDKQSSVTFVLLTNGLVEEKAKKAFERLKKSASQEDGADNYEWKLVDLSQIHADKKQMSSAQSPKLAEIPVHSQSNGKQHILLDEIHKNDKEYKTIVAIIHGTTLKKLYEQYGSSLFNDNIREFLGNKSKNKSIRKTLDEEPEFFYLYNNGISAICSNLEIKNTGKDVFVCCEEFQIINGAQTAGCIHNYGTSSGASNKPNLDKVMILLRITQIKSMKGEKDLKRKIITNNNTQNIIRDADFRSNDLVQTSLQDKFTAEAFQYKASNPPCPLVYHPKRSGIPTAGKRNIIHISMEDMAKSLYAFLYDPSKLNSQTKFLFDNTSHGSYWDLFGKNSKETDTINTKTARQFAAIAMLKIYLDSRLKQGAKDETVDTLLGMTYRSGRHFLWAFGYVMRTFYPDKQKKIYDKIIDGTAFQEGEFAPSWYEHIRKAIRSALKRESMSRSGKTLNFKMWLRSPSKVENIAELLNDIEETDGLPPV